MNPNDPKGWDAGRYARNARFVAELGAPVLDLLDPRPGERVLDLGCGDGALTAQIVARGADVLGVDAAPDMVSAARARGVSAELADGARLGFSSEFDAVFSNAAMHWMPDQAAVVAGVAQALKPGGRFVGEMGGHGNIAAVFTAIRAVLMRRGLTPNDAHPRTYPTVDAHAERLVAAGFVVEEIALIPRPTPLPTGLRGWLDVFFAPFAGQALEPDDRDRAKAEIVELCAPSLEDERGRWTADYVRLRWRARLR